MQLSLRDVCKVMQVTSNDVYAWVSEKNLPAMKVNGQYHFHKADLLEWATANNVRLPATFLWDENRPVEKFHLAAVLKAGGIFYHVPGSDPSTALLSVVERLSLPAGFNRQELHELFMARESLGSTGVGDGIAIPHPRAPLVLPLESATMTLCFLEQPIDFWASDGKPVDTLFVAISPTAGGHLGLLSELACALRTPRFHAAVKRKAPAAEILAEARRVKEAAAQHAQQP